jgi:hypothetical protein
MNQNLIKEAVWCHKMSTSEKYKEDKHNAVRHQSCLHELIRLMTKEELEQYHKIIEKNDN